ncbi:MAG: hypothetical protein JST40_10175 [Armatimonadetes bacterium]|nr:hypothetical protein [Armatimonadota bacterium]
MAQYDDSVLENLAQELRELNRLLQIQIEHQQSWKLALRNGLLAGLGGVLGATVVVSLLLAVLKPFKSLDALGPVIDKLDRSIENGRR